LTRMLKEVIHARGHWNVTATHRSTFEVTTETDMSLAGDCIVAVGADKGASSFSEEFKIAAANDDSYMIARIICDDYTDIIMGWGSAAMTFTDPRSMVFRVSDFVCGRTVMIHADKPAVRLNRDLVKALAEGKDVVIEITVENRERPQPSFNTLF
jgi:uncharacterized protein